MKVVIIGGGIAGSTILHELEQYRSVVNDSSRIELVMLTPTRSIKLIKQNVRLTRYLEELDIEEQDMEEDKSHVKGYVTRIDTKNKIIYDDESQLSMTYDICCIASGALPKQITPCPSSLSEYVLTLRDLESVQYLCNRLKYAKKIVIVGNGGIALELIMALKECHLVWCIKDDYIGNRFFDAGASEFFLKQNHTMSHAKDISPPLIRTPPVNFSRNHRKPSAGLGPGWSTSFDRVKNALQLDQNSFFTSKVLDNVTFEFMTEVKELSKTTNSIWPVQVHLTNGKTVECDFIISAIGVTPNTAFTGEEFRKDEEGALFVNENLETNLRDIYAVGDCCRSEWDDMPLHWFQMRLWSQARTMGIHAAFCMSQKMNWIDQNAFSPVSISFDMFAHVTRFFGYKVILLGLYNAQKLNKNDYNTVIRCDGHSEYIKAVMKDGRVQGAMLIGDTNLEETFENLILNQTDLSMHGEHFLDPDIDIEDYFD